MSLKKSKNEQFVTSDEILKMKYTMKVVDETIRMANIAAIVFRTTIKDVNYKGIYMMFYSVNLFYDHLAKLLFIL